MSTALWSMTLAAALGAEPYGDFAPPSAASPSPGAVYDEGAVAEEPAGWGRFGFGSRLRNLWNRGGASNSEYSEQNAVPFPQNTLPPQQYAQNTLPPSQPIGGEVPLAAPPSSMAPGDPLFPYDAQPPWLHGYFQEIPAYGGYALFRPYNYKHVLAQAQVAGGWGMPPTSPYSQQFWHRYHREATMQYGAPGWENADPPSPELPVPPRRSRDVPPPSRTEPNVLPDPPAASGNSTAFRGYRRPSRGSDHRSVRGRRSPFQPVPPRHRATGGTRPRYLDADRSGREPSRSAHGPFLPAPTRR